MNKPVCIAFISLFCFQLFGQNNDTLQVNFKMVFDKIPLELNKEYISSNNDKINLTAFKCYVSAIEIHYEDKTIFKKQNSYHLLDLENPKSLQIPITQKNENPISKIVFNIGIDSLTNTSGAMSGDLDPTKGMYWAWQSGYINMKIEGKSPSCTTRKNQFQFHIGGYLKPFYAMKIIEIPIQKSQSRNFGTSEITIQIDLAKLFSEINLKEVNSIMTPSEASMKMASLIPKMFYIE